jgi:hypothetical protein
MWAHYKKLRNGVQKLKKDNKKALVYETGMMGLDRQEEQQEQGKSER